MEKMFNSLYYLPLPSFQSKSSFSSWLVHAQKPASKVQNPEIQKRWEIDNTENSQTFTSFFRFFHLFELNIVNGNETSETTIDVIDRFGISFENDL